MFRWFYTFLVYVIFLPLALLKLFWRSKKNKAYRQGIAERFGFISIPSDLPVIWVHAVSVGETIAIRPLIDALLQKYPNYRILLTNGTITGRHRAEALFGNRLLYSYAPYDVPQIIKRFLFRVKPALVLIMETELWLNWMYVLKSPHIPVMLVNGRLSERSYHSYQRFACLFKPAWQAFTLIAAQGEPDAKRYALLGVESARIHVTGNLKYNFTLAPNLTAEVAAWRQVIVTSQIWLAASTHETEEQKLLIVFKALKEQYPEMLWILVPRHPERIAEVKKLCISEGWSVVLRSEYAATPQQTIAADILLVDTMGELPLFYALADVAFVAGSLVSNKGGHNILEAAAVGTPIMVGPSMFNFATILSAFKDANAIIQCQDLASLTQQTLNLFKDKVLREQLSANAKVCFEQNQESLPKHLALIETILK
ncbi:MAG: 3-deoxy-D-manno-octulosonic acid transferase [Gammaproteobacteria bacterium]|jgi:3-deoxy-D-manno-octulosonic-acid transferase|nr:3-deoxy-D-manno-octulosonic acid transferase [Gammaproteobacteria bacterium]